MVFLINTNLIAVRFRADQILFRVPSLQLCSGRTKEVRGRHGMRAASRANDAGSSTFDRACCLRKQLVDLGPNFGAATVVARSTGGRVASDGPGNELDPIGLFKSMRTYVTTVSFE